MSGLRLDPENLWYSKNLLSTGLLPLSWLFRAIVTVRRFYYRVYHYRRALPSVFILVVGNLTVGGTGKTPFLIWLARQCRGHGLKVGIITRGYKKHQAGKILEALPHSMSKEVGDEALLLVQKTACPVIVAANRMQAVGLLLSKYRPDVILSDDGLQHYKLPRNVEIAIVDGARQFGNGTIYDGNFNVARQFVIAIVDGARQFGNGRCLPAGPLREPVSRIQECDLVVSNGRNDNYKYSFETVPESAVSLGPDTVRRPLQDFMDCTVHAVAGLGNPARFFRMLESAGIRIIRHVFPDHHAYVEADLEFGDNKPILMTEKDAVKCKLFVDRNIWYLPIIVQPSPLLEQRISTLIEGIPRANAVT